MIKSLVAAVNKPLLTLNHHFSLKLNDPANYSSDTNGILGGNGKVDVDPIRDRSRDPMRIDDIIQY